MPSSANFFQRYVLQQYRNTLTRYDSYYPPEVVKRYWFELQLSSEQYALLVSQLPLQAGAGDVPLLGALLYYNVNSTKSPGAYAVVWWYSTEFPQASFSAASFPLSNWPVDFDLEAAVHSSLAIPIPSDVVLSTTATFYESSESLPSCHILKIRVVVPTEPSSPYYQNVFHPIDDQKTIQSAVYPPDLYNTESDKNSVISTSTSVKNWIAINKAYLQSLPYPLPTASNSRSISSPPFFPSTL